MSDEELVPSRKRLEVRMNTQDYNDFMSFLRKTKEPNKSALVRKIWRLAEKLKKYSGEGFEFQAVKNGKATKVDLGF